MTLQHARSLAAAPFAPQTTTLRIKVRSCILLGMFGACVDDGDFHQAWRALPAAQALIGLRWP